MCQTKLTLKRRSRAIQTVTLSFFRFDRFYEKAWAFAQMGLARPAMAALPGVRFWKLCGSGTGEGFTPRPNTAVYAILTVWDTPEAARAGLSAPVFARYRRHASESYTLFLAPTSARGAWSGRAPFHTGAPHPGPIAALTRATIKPRIALQFWRRVPNISRVIGADPNVLFKIGIGEVPLLHQITFSVWPDAASMAQFARHDGPHAHAIQAVRDGAWFSEELYARFAVIHAEGTWEGRAPIPLQEHAA